MVTCQLLLVSLLSCHALRIVRLLNKMHPSRPSQASHVRSLETSMEMVARRRQKSSAQLSLGMTPASPVNDTGQIELLVVG